MSHFEQARNTVDAAGTAARIALHGVAASFARMRLERAEMTIERMERKNELYEELGKMATFLSTGGPYGKGISKSVVAAARPDDSIKPQTFSERVVDWRMDRRTRKKISADNKSRRDSTVFGPDHSTPIKSVRQSMIDRVLSVPLRDRDAGEGVLSAVIGNTKAVVVGPDLDARTHKQRVANSKNADENRKGTTDLTKKIRIAQNNYEYLKGDKIAADRCKEKNTIKATMSKQGDKAHRKTRRTKRRAEERLNHMIEMPVTSAWRGARLNRAGKQASKMQAKIERHRNRIDELRR